MGELLSKVIPLALGAAVSPTVLIVVLLVLSGRRAIARGTAFVAGVLVVLSGLTVLGLLLSKPAHASAVQTDVTRAIDGLVGTLLLLLAARTVMRMILSRRTGSSEPTDTSGTDAQRSTGLVTAFVLGVAMMLSNFSTILLYLPAMHEISTSTVGFRDKVLAVALAFVITSIPATGPLALRLTLPDASARLLDRLRTLATRYQRQIGITIELVFGVYLVVKALR